MDRNLIFHHIMTKNILKKKNFKNFSAISWKWTTECFKIDCGHNLLIEISFKKYRTIKQICTILKCQYVTKATFSYLPTINVTFLIFHHFPVESPRCVFLLCLPVVFPVVLPRCASPLCSPSGILDPEGLFLNCHVWDLRHLCPKKAAWCWGKIMANQRRRLHKISHF